MRDIRKTKPHVNYKIVSKNINVNYLKQGINCFRDIFNNRDKFDSKSIITLTNFRTEELDKYVEKYFQILSKIFKVEIIFITEDTIEVKNFKSKFHLKVFLTMYRILFELTCVYGDDIKGELQKRIVYFEDLCNSKFEKLDELQQLLTSHNLSKIYMGNHCLKSRGKDSKVKILSIEEFHNMEILDNQDIGLFFLNTESI